MPVAESESQDPLAFQLKKVDLGVEGGGAGGGSSTALETTKPPTASMGKGAGDLQEAKRGSQLQLVVAFVAVVALGLLIGVIVLSTKEKTNAGNGTGGQQCQTEACVAVTAELKGSMDSTAQPCNDFYQYACGNWAKTAVATSSRPVISRVSLVDQVILQRLTRALESPLEGEVTPTPRSVQLARTFYRSCLNIANMDLVGATPIIARMNSAFPVPLTTNNIREAMDNLTGVMHAQPFVTISLSFDAGDRTAIPRRMITIRPAALIPTVGTTSAYRQEAGRRHRSAKTQGNRVRRQVIYQTRAPPDDAAQEMARQTQLRTLVNLLGLDETHAGAINNIDQNRGEADGSMDVMTLDALTMNHGRNVFNFRSMVESVLSPATRGTIDGNTRVIVHSGAYISRLAMEIANFLDANNGDPDALRTYIKFKSVQHLLPFLGQAFRNAIETYNYAIQNPVAARSCVSTTMAYFPNAVDLLYLEHFTGGQRVINEVKMMAKNVQDEARDAFSRMTWIPVADRNKIVEKIAQMQMVVGLSETVDSFDEVNRQYTNFAPNLTCFACSLIEAISVRRQVELDLLTIPYSSANFSITRNSVLNAFYEPDFNYAVVPIGILTQPLYSADADNIIKYSRMGVTLSHEIGHGLDAFGILRNQSGVEGAAWLSSAFRNLFNTRSRCIADFYSTFRFRNQPINGNTSLDENIADLIGISVALRTYRKLFASSAVMQEVANAAGMTTDQSFFLSYATSQCNKVNINSDTSNLLAGTYPPDIFRVIGPLSQMPEFAEAFKCGAGTAMNPASRCGMYFG